MTRYGKTRKEETRHSIVTRAATRFRKDGLAAVGLRALMTDAGLTHGGFYAHFPARNALVAEAVGAALAETRDRLAEAADRAGLEGVLDHYLDPRHRDRPERGCAGASLAPEIAREGAETRERFSAGIAAIQQVLADQLPDGGTAAERRARARAIFALLMGSIQLARAEPDPDASAAMLQTARDTARQIARQPWSDRRS